MQHIYFIWHSHEEPETIHLRMLPKKLLQEMLPHHLLALIPSRLVSAKVYLLLHACKSTSMWEILKLYACKQRGEAPDISLEQTVQQQPGMSGTRSMKGCAQWGRRNGHLSSFFIPLLWSHCPLLVEKCPARSCTLCTQPFVATHFWSHSNFPGTG